MEEIKQSEEDDCGIQCLNIDFNEILKSKEERRRIQEENEKRSLESYNKFINDGIERDKQEKIRRHKQNEIRDKIVLISISLLLGLFMIKRKINKK